MANAGYQVAIFGKVADKLPGALQLAPNGFDALVQLGALEAVRPHLMRLSAIELRSVRTNGCLTVIDHDRPQARDYASIGRHDLHKSLLALARQHSLISFCDEMVTNLTCNQDITCVRSESGTVHPMSLIIGADGQNGLARRMIAPHDHKDKGARQALRAVVPSGELPRHFSAPRTQLWLGEGFHLVSYPFAGGALINLVLCTPAFARPASDIVRHYLGQSYSLSVLCDEAIDWHSTPLASASQLSTWRKYGLIVVGDAAHIMPPHLAQGAGQTLEDAASLHLALLQTDDLRQAASQWAVQRARTLSPIIDKAEATGRLMRLSGPMAKLRNAAIEMGGGRLVESWLSQVWHSPR